MPDFPLWLRLRRLGTPLSRDNEAFVLYKMPAEQLCRQQSFKYTEVYSGGGEYQAPGGVRLNYICYLPCQ